MFENLRAAFREAVKNFHDELGRDRIPEAVDQLLYAMKQEITDAKTRLHDLKDGIERARADAQKEAAEASTARRREGMARGIGDGETADIAAEYAKKHERRREVLEQKARALEDEFKVRESEIEDMMGQLREAMKQRQTLASTAGRAQALDSIQGGNDLFDELDRMSDRIGESGAEELDRELEAMQERSSVENRLEELKRRMGRD